MELNMPALQEERFLEYHGKMFKDQENRPMKEAIRKTDHWRNSIFKDPSRNYLPKVFLKKCVTSEIGDANILLSRLED